MKKNFLMDMDGVLVHGSRAITGADKFEWSALLAAAGIEVVTANSTPALRVVAKPSGRQKDLLDKLGYNNWRKSTVNNR